MLYTLEFSGFHDAKRLERFVELAERLGADLPYGIDPLFSYRLGRPLPEVLPLESLVYLSDIVFYSGVAWCTAGPPPTDLELIGRYADIEELARAPRILASPPRADLAEMILEPDRPVHALLPEAFAREPEQFEGIERARQTRGIIELRAPRWAELARHRSFSVPMVVAHEPLPLVDAFLGFLVGDELQLASLARTEQPCGVLGFHHMDDDFLLSLNQPFWHHEDGNTIRL